MTRENRECVAARLLLRKVVQRSLDGKRKRRGKGGKEEKKEEKGPGSIKFL